jgi:thiol peroxidase
MSNRTTTLKGNPLDLTGPELKVGDAAPDAVLRKDLVSDIKLSEIPGAKLLSVVPSVDTPICALQTKRFNEEAAKLPGVTFVTISADLPVALSRFCGAENIDPEKLICLSDHKDIDFGQKYGTLVPGLRIECRALFVVDQDNVLRHVEYVPEIADHPNYDAALDCAKNLA